MTEPTIMVWRDGAAQIEHESGRSIFIASSGGVLFAVDGIGIGTHPRLVPWRHFFWLLHGHGLDAVEDNVHE